MLKYYISIFSLVLYTSLMAQKPSKVAAFPKDSLQINNKTSLKIRLGVDIGKYIWAKVHQSQSIDLVADAAIKKNYFVVLNLGQENRHSENSLLNFDTKGSYIRLGLDYNLYDNWLDMDNQICLGFRYGFSRFYNHLNSYTINQSDAAILPQTITVDKDFSPLSAHWLELTSTMQVETFKNLYLGVGLSLKYLLATGQNEGFEVAYIPGFYKKNTYTNLGFGVQYLISYRFKI